MQTQSECVWQSKKAISMLSRKAGRSVTRTGKSFLYFSEKLKKRNRHCIALSSDKT